jgi:copper chaperone CopZ
MLRTAIVLALSMASGAAFACDGAKATAGGKSQCHMSEAANRVAAMEGAIPAGATLVNYTVDGVECGNCAKGIRAALEATPGVAGAHVNTEKGTIEVGYDPKQITPAEIAETINRLESGKYKAKLAQS